MHLSDPGLVFESGSPADVRGDDRAFSLQRTGRVRSRRMYDDFAIEFEFRVHDDVSAAAVELRTAIQNGVARSRGYVLWLTGGNAGKVVAPDGGQVRSWPEVPAFTPPADRWHSARITCEGTHVSVLLDDEPERLFGVAPTAAPIVLFAEGGPVDFRKIVVREMEPAKRERLLPAGVYAPTDAEIPRVVREVKPNYTPAAMQRKVQGVVQLEAVVLPDGSVGEVYVTKQLDPDLDYEAVAAVKKWRFIPGMRAGKPVPVLVTIELTFSLRGR